MEDDLNFVCCIMLYTSFKAELALFSANPTHILRNLPHSLTDNTYPLQPTKHILRNIYHIASTTKNIASATGESLFIIIFGYKIS